MLRDAGPDVYDQWVNHEIPFNDPQVADGARPRSATILKNDKYVNGGFGDVKSHRHHRVPGRRPADPRRASAPCTARRRFYAANWPEGTKVGRGRRRLRVLPAGRSTRTTASRSSAAASSSRRSPTVPRSRRSRPTCPPTRGPTRRPRPRRPAAGSAPTRASTSTTWCSPIDKLSAEILQDPNAVVPLRRLRPDAGRRRRRLLLEGDDRLDHRPEHQGRRSTTSRAPGRSDLTPDLTRSPAGPRAGRPAPGSSTASDRAESASRHVPSRCWTARAARPREVRCPSG